jgi:HAD superfamily hydrolase (TIGR01509 family)
LNRFKAAVFDMDGLLLDSESLALQSFNSTCAHFKLPELRHVFDRLIGTNAVHGQLILEQGLAGEVDHHHFESLWDERYKQLTTERPVPLMPGVSTLLRSLQSMGMPMAVATSSKTESAVRKLSESGIYDYFDLLVGGDQVSHSKPDPEIFIRAAAQLKVDASKCVAFEDSANGVKAAVGAGMTVIQIPDLVQPDENLLALGHIVLQQIDDVLTYEF